MSQYQQFNLLCWQKKYYTYNTILQSPILIFVEPIWCFPFILLLPMLVHFSSGLVMGPSCTYSLHTVHTYRLESSQDLNFKLVIETKAQLWPLIFPELWTEPEQNFYKIKYFKNQSLSKITYRKVESSNTSRLEAQACFFRLLMKEIFYPYALWPFDKKLLSLLVIRIRTRDYTVYICCSPNH